MPTSTFESSSSCSFFWVLSSSTQQNSFARRCFCFCFTFFLLYSSLRLPVAVLLRQVKMLCSRRHVELCWGDDIWRRLFTLGSFIARPFVAGPPLIGPSVVRPSVARAWVVGPYVVRSCVVGPSVVSSYIVGHL